MPFDKISPRLLFILRILTGVSLLAIGGVLAYLAGAACLDPTQSVARFSAPTNMVFYVAGLVFGVLLANAGMMLLELVTKPPFKMAINVPFVAANFQTAAAVGIVAMVFAVKHALLPAEMSGDVQLIQVLSIVGFAFCMTFVVMTKMHYNFTENTGKELPKH